MQEVKSFFDVVKDILSKTSGGNLHKETNLSKVCSSFMLIRGLSMHPGTRVYAQILNKYQTVLTVVQIYQWAYNAVPKQKSAYFKYLSKQKQEKSITNEAVD